MCFDCICIHLTEINDENLNEPLIDSRVTSRGEKINQFKGEKSVEIWNRRRTGHNPLLALRTDAPRSDNIVINKGLNGIINAHMDVKILCEGSNDAAQTQSIS